MSWGIWGRFLLSNISTVFIVEVMAAEAMFSIRFRRRENFALRAGHGVMICLAAAFLLPWLLMLTPDIPFGSVVTLFLLLFAVTLVVLPCCFHCTAYDAIFCGVASYAVQNALYQTTELLNLLPVGFSRRRVLSVLLLLALHLLFYGTAWFFLARTGAGEHYSVSQGRLVGLSCLMMIIVLRVLPTEPNVSAAHQASWLFLHILCCGLSLYLLFGMSENSRLRQELDMMNQLWHTKEEHYELTKENIQIINVKCHDLKYQLEALRRSADSTVDKQALQELEDSVMIYESTAHTGSDALDIILTEKSLFCEKNHIKLTYMVDGEALAFIRPIDLYAIFGNALDNAVESVIQIEDPSRRLITLTAEVNGKLLAVTMKNYYARPPQVQDGLPITSKDDPRYHGYGLKSIRLMAQKYGSGMTFSARDGIFTLNLILPIPAQSTAAG